ncbi:type II secretion system protein [Microbacterium sp. 22242]|uniref:type II secretion system protein n=1 Tax=Microbacterium sp. 22242 TaxID=3453896 RepID=UPI003F86EA41
MNSSTDRAEDGFSLIELIFFVVILGLITTGIAVVFFNMWKAQASVSGQVDATERGQLIASQVERAMRDGIAFSVPSGSTLLVATSSASNACMGFSFVDGTMTPPGTANLAITSGTSLSTASWPAWQSGIVAHPLSGGGFDPFFAIVSPNTIRYSFDVKSANGPTVHFEGTGYLRSASAPTDANWGVRPGGGAQTCF